MNEIHENGEYVLDMARYNISSLVQRMFVSGDDQMRVVAPWEMIESQVTSLYEALEEYKEHALSSATRAEICGRYTIYHSINVSILSMYIAMMIGKEKKEIITIGIAGLLHDIGKKYISNPVLEKTSPLSESEQEIFRMHPKLGYNLIKNHYPEAPKMVLSGILMHHERLDGSGYPEGKTNIPESARIIAIADVFEAYTSVRPYHSSRSLSEGFDFIKSSQDLDTKIVDIFHQKEAVGCSS